MNIGLRVSRPLGLPRLDPVGYLRRLDADYRDRRRLREMTPEQLSDIGLTRADIERAFDRG